MSLQRQFNRNSLKKLVKNRNLSSTWEIFQRKKYGDWYKKICKKSKNGSGNNNN